MRLFLAVDVDRSTRQHVAAWREGVLRAQPSAERLLRWVSPEQMHVTMQFLGEQDTVAAILVALNVPLVTAGFELEWASTGWLPPRGRPRVLYLGVGAGAKQLTAMATELAQRLETLGIEGEARPYTPHMTLARVRDGAPVYAVQGFAALCGGQPAAAGVRVPVRGVTLYASELSPGGPTYRVLHRLTLS